MILTEFWTSEWFIIGYYIVMVAASLLLVRETGARIASLRRGIGSAKYAAAPFAVILVYAFVGFEVLDSIDGLNWSWLGYNIAFGPFVEQGVWGVVPFVLPLIYMFLHINYAEEAYFRRSKKMVLLWAAIHIGAGIKVHSVLMLIPVGFLFKYIYDKKGLDHAYAMHFVTNVAVTGSLLLSFVA